MNIWKVIKSIQVAINNLILCEKRSNNTPAAAIKPRQGVLNKTVIEALMMEPDIKTPIISAISITIVKDLYFDTQDGIEDGDNDNDNEDDDIHSARHSAQ